MIERLLLLGATGDLASRFLLPALAELLASERLPHDFEVVGAVREELSDAAYRDLASGQLEKFASDVPSAVRKAMVERLSYVSMDFAADGLPDRIQRALGSDSRPHAVYLALPPQLFAPVVAALDNVPLPSGSRLVLEKPFGQSLDDAVALNELIAMVTGSESDAVVFRVDHVLGMATVHNLLRMRFANRVLAELWNGTHIESVEILWEETLGLEGRAGYYDSAGALKDVIQNHLIQILARFPLDGVPVSPFSNELRIGLDGPDTLSLHLMGSTPGPPSELSLLSLTSELPGSELRAYSHVLLDILTGESFLSVRGDEAEQAWRIVAPVLRAWKENRVPLEEYPAGSEGPKWRRRE